LAKVRHQKPLQKRAFLLTRLNSVLQRLICLILAGAFLFQELSYALPAGRQGPPLVPSPVIHDPISSFEAPIEYCSLKEIHRGQSNKPFIIHIQDAHANVSGQQNLASTLDQIMSKYGVSLVLSEGGSQDCSLTPIKKMAPPEVWKKIAKSYLVQGKITGEEYLNLTSNHPMKIMGLEDITLYLRSVQNYAELADKREAALAYLKQIQAAAEKLKRKLYPKELLEYEGLSHPSLRGGAKGADEAISARKIAALATLARNDRVDLSSFPTIQQLLTLQQIENKIDFNLANLEQAAIVEEIQKKGGKEDLNTYLQKLSQIKDQRVLQFTHFQSLLNITRQKNIDISSYPNFTKYGEYLKEFSNLDLDQLLDELEKLEDRVYLTVIASAPQGARGDLLEEIASSPAAPRNDILLVRAIDRYLHLLHVAYEIQMTTTEFNTFLVNEPDFSTPSYLAFLNRKLLEEGYFQDLIPYKNLLEEGKKSLTGFYDSVSKRDEAFIENMEKTIIKESGKQKAESGATFHFPLSAFLITGGYHTQNLKKLLKEKGYSYAVLTPIVTSETNQKNYEKQLLSPIQSEKRIVEVDSSQQSVARNKSGHDGVRAALLLAATRINPNISLTKDERQILQHFQESTTQNFRRFLEDTLRWEKVPEDQINWRVEQIMKELDQPFKTTPTVISSTPQAGEKSHSIGLEPRVRSPEQGARMAAETQRENKKVKQGSRLNPWLLRILFISIFLMPSVTFFTWLPPQNITSVIVENWNLSVHWEKRLSAETEGERALIHVKRLSIGLNGVQAEDFTYSDFFPLIKKFLEKGGARLAAHLLVTSGMVTAPTTAARLASGGEDLSKFLGLLQESIRSGDVGGLPNIPVIMGWIPELAATWREKAIPGIQVFIEHGRQLDQSPQVVLLPLLSELNPLWAFPQGIAFAAHRIGGKLTVVVHTLFGTPQYLAFPHARIPVVVTDLSQVSGGLMQWNSAMQIFFINPSDRLHFIIHQSFDSLSLPQNPFPGQRSWEEYLASYVVTAFMEETRHALDHFNLRNAVDQMRLLPNDQQRRQIGLLLLRQNTPTLDFYDNPFIGPLAGQQRTPQGEDQMRQGIWSVFTELSGQMTGGALGDAGIVWNRWQARDPDIDAGNRSLPQELITEYTSRMFGTMLIGAELGFLSPDILQSIGVSTPLNIRSAADITPEVFAYAMANFTRYRQVAERISSKFEKSEGFASERLPQAFRSVFSRIYVSPLEEAPLNKPDQLRSVLESLPLGLQFPKSSKISSASPSVWDLRDISQDKISFGFRTKDSGELTRWIGSALAKHKRDLPNDERFLVRPPDTSLRVKRTGWVFGRSTAVHVDTHTVVIRLNPKSEETVQNAIIELAPAIQTALRGGGLYPLPQELEALRNQRSQITAARLANIQKLLLDAKKDLETGTQYPFTLGELYDLDTEMSQQEIAKLNAQLSVKEALEVFKREIWPLRGDLEGFLEYMSRYHQPLTEFQRLISEEVILSKESRGPDKIIMASPKAALLWIAFLGIEEIPLGVHFLLKDGKGNVKNIFLMRNDSTDYQALITWAHETAHAHQFSSAYNLYQKHSLWEVVIEGFQRYREKELVLSLMSRRTSLGRQARQVVEVAYRERMKASYPNSPQLLARVFGLRVFSKSPEMRLKALLDDGSYLDENRFVRGLISVVGRPPVEALHQQGRIDSLRSKLGAHRLNLLTHFFDRREGLSNKLEAYSMRPLWESMFRRLSIDIAIDLFLSAQDVSKISQKQIDAFFTELQASIISSKDADKLLRLIRSGGFRANSKKVIEVRRQLSNLSMGYFSAKIDQIQFKKAIDELLKSLTKDAARLAWYETQPSTAWLAGHVETPVAAIGLNSPEIARFSDVYGARLTTHHANPLDELGDSRTLFLQMILKKLPEDKYALLGKTGLSFWSIKAKADGDFVIRFFDDLTKPEQDQKLIHQETVTRRELEDFKNKTVFEGKGISRPLARPRNDGELEAKAALLDQNRGARVFDRASKALLAGEPILGNVYLNADLFASEGQFDLSSQSFLRHVEILKVLEERFRQDRTYQQVHWVLYSSSGNARILEFLQNQGFETISPDSPFNVRVAAKGEKVPAGTGYAFMDYAGENYLSPVIPMAYYSLYLLSIQNKKDSIRASNIEDSVLSEIKRLSGNTPKDIELTPQHVLDFGKGNLESLRVALLYMARPLTKLLSQAFTQFLAELKAIGSAA